MELNKLKIFQLFCIKEVENLCTYFPEPRTEVYCLRLNFNMSKLVYSQGAVLNGHFHQYCLKIGTKGVCVEYVDPESNFH